jgi:uncharacterized protein (TIGR02466 family)
MRQSLQDARYGTLFGTALLDYQWPDSAALNAGLRDKILEHERRSVGTQLTNAGGWHSETGVLGFCGEPGQVLIQRIMAMTEEATNRVYAEFGQPAPSLSWIFSAWANINRRGNSNKTHAHPGATWSGVYYVDDGGVAPGEAATAIHLIDPCPTRTNVFFPELTASDILFPPTPGLMILFPSYLPHAVAPHTGERPRISVAFNLRKEPFP